MKKHTKILIITTIILTLALTPGCLGEKQETPTYPNAEKIETPTNISKEIINETGFEGIINIYKTTDNPEKIETWYENEMTNQTWKELTKQSGIQFWEKENTIHGIQTLTPQEAQKELNINQTVIITITVPPIQL
ncbi:hypothetical protein AMET1_1257 [Methanonatronarchaeum thermophilum]|uniref:Uncharacterized protein n=1 Tax=Methanonatronarchaeum thermophilum TaxID=1927129 RepID=A0A1Y3GFV8_9EURY|nr:hypothetical protein [Methanonatronarchaeum thermophilum]OUJ18345.1 hypothetical protein AMET1_1257 [Methanonatronarchaeum thermophilum]